MKKVDFRHFEGAVCICMALIFAVMTLSGCMSDGENGLSAYEIALKNGSTDAKSEKEWLDSLNGQNGKDGKDGLSAFDLAKQTGFEGSLDNWLSSLCGKEGRQGKSAYEVAADNGYSGSEQDWVSELLGSRKEEGTGSGVGISSVFVNADKHLIVRLTNGTSIDAGYVGVSDGEGQQSGDITDSDGYKKVNQTVTVIAGALNIRSSPDSSSAKNIVTHLNMGAELNRIGIGVGDNTWSKVMYEGKICYASTKYLEVKSENAGSTDLTGVEIPRVNLPDEYIIPVGKETNFEADQFTVGLCEGMYISFAYSGSGTKTITSHSLTVKPDKAEKATMTFSIKKYVGGTLTVLYSKDVILTSVLPVNKKLTGLVIGDSRISDGNFVNALKNNCGFSLNLIGTLKNAAGTRHEGRGSWSTSNYLSYRMVSGSENPFYNPSSRKFDFSYYLKNNNFECPDFVIFYLGANDGYSPLSILNYRELTESVKKCGSAYKKDIKILIMHEYLAPADGYRVSYAFDSAKRRNEQFEYFNRLTAEFGNLAGKGIYLVSAHTCISNPGDRICANNDGVVTDVIHISKSGYIKQADIAGAYIDSIFAVK